MAREESFFDELARGLADGSVTRGKALRLMGAAVVGGTLGSLGIDGEASADPIGCKRNGKNCTRNEQCCSKNCSSGTCQAQTTTTTTSTTSTSTTPPPPPVQCDNALNDCSTDPCICGTGTTCVSGKCVQAIQCDNALNNCATDPCICGTGTTCVSGKCI